MQAFQNLKMRCNACVPAPLQTKHTHSQTYTAYVYIQYDQILQRALVYSLKNQSFWDRLLLHLSKTKIVPKFSTIQLVTSSLGLGQHGCRSPERLKMVYCWLLAFVFIKTYAYLKPPPITTPTTILRHPENILYKAPVDAKE